MYDSSQTWGCCESISTNTLSVQLLFKARQKTPDCRACAIIGRKGYRSIFSWVYRNVLVLPHFQSLASMWHVLMTNGFLPSETASALKNIPSRKCGFVMCEWKTGPHVSCGSVKWVSRCRSKTGGIKRSQDWCWFNEESCRQLPANRDNNSPRKDNVLCLLCSP